MVPGLAIALMLAGCNPPESVAKRESGDKLDSLVEPVATSPFEDPEPTVTSPPVVETAPDNPSPAAAVEKKQFPRDRVLTSADGRSIRGTILGKKGGEIAFRRASDGRAFVLSIDRLSAGDQLDLAELSDEGTETVVALKAPSGPAAGESETGKVKVAVGKRPRRAEWHEDPDAAFAEAAELGLPVYVVFTGSDWCPPCKQLEKTIHEASAFSDFADEHLVLLKLDFPRRKSQSSKVKERNREMASEWGVNSYPSLFLTTGPDGTRENVTRVADVKGFIEAMKEQLRRLPQKS
jgi:thiol-disulfide isomerase/thioredoxin